MPLQLLHHHDHHDGVRLGIEADQPDGGPIGGRSQLVNEDGMRMSDDKGRSDWRSSSLVVSFRDLDWRYGRSVSCDLCPVWVFQAVVGFAGIDATVPTSLQRS